MRARHPTGSLWPLWRGVALVVLLVITLAGAGCGSSASAGALTPTSTIQRSAPQRLSSSAWERISLPGVATDTKGIAISPTDPSVMFSCTGRPLALWRSTDAGATWTQYTPTLGAASYCSFSFAPDDSNLVALQAAMLGQDSQACVRDTFYLSHDGGGAWRELPPHAFIAPGGTAASSCDLQVTRHHLYLHDYYEQTGQSPQLSLLERSDDDGATWTRADRGLGDDALYFMPQVGPGEMLALTVVRMPTAPDPAAMKGAELWTSADAGATWREVSTLPVGAGTALWSSWPQGDGASAAQGWPSPVHPFYALESDQIPSNLYRERAQMSSDGKHWTLLSPLPVSGASAERPGILQALTVLPDGRLAVWGPGPQGSVPAAGAYPKEVESFWLWLWSPATRRWQAFPAPLPTPASEGCGLCWGAEAVASKDGATYLYVKRLESGPSSEPRPGMFRIRLPASA